MIKKISYLCLAFTFSFLCFSYNVKAEIQFSNRITEINFDNFSSNSNYFTNDDLQYLNNYFINADFDICTYGFVSGGPIFSCIKNLSNYSFNKYSNDQYVRLIYTGDFYTNSSFNNHVFSSNFDFIKSNSYTPFFSFQYVFFWSRNDLLLDDNVSYYIFIDDVIYDDINSNLKQFYNFQNYLHSGYPLYSLINLRLGNWRGYTGNVELIKCFDNVCDNSGTNYSYKYGTVGESIDLTSELDSEYNGYNLDLNYTYSINSGQTSTLNIYYYSTQIPYTIFYYFDNELQSNLTESLSGSNGSLISLDNLDSVKNDIYYLDTTRDYSITLTSGQTNAINVYYNSIDVNYDINVYLDDIYYKSYSSIGTGKVGQTITLDNLDSEIDIFTLDLREYELSLCENRELNYVNVYYYSDNYGTKYQDIDTTGKFYISFDWVYIKELFNLKGLYTQTEQFVIVYVVNFLFYAIVCIFAVIGIKMLFRLFNLFKMF